MSTAAEKLPTTDRAFAFPGPWLGGVSLIAGPLLLLAGTLLRLGVPFFFPHQLAAYQRQPGLIGTAYVLFLAGTITLWPGVAAVAVRVGATRPGWALWGGGLVLSGLFARTFHHGVDVFVFSLVESTGLSPATRAVSAYYTYPERVVSSLSVAVMLGWSILAIGCFLSGTLRLAPAIALALMSGLMIGVLKGSTWASVVQVTGLTVALVPLGVRFLRGAGRPPWRTMSLVVVFLAGSIILGQLG
ncbi:hypothetical protein [Actinoplanes couchii]|uniref:Uncharacterized protein n=1 Tax=Actinoplanes couchii TaxID=403638 RepID=A0ABQ3XPR6_9ACTN|nr:hypothetical protein [Actinoplanes couchii]MDR6319166.1 membrane protein implicated in regulation of membrane protease activity [Actinoplanes couchii]GID60506.1 hypothetical protein Aco03nite_089100 [Actinoplanes couchii]